MIELRPARAQDTERCKALWKMAFGDGDAYLDLFFTCDYHPEQMLLLLEDGVAMTMLYLMPMTLKGPDITATAHYVYALATDPAARKQGYGRQLLHAADRYVQDWGDDCMTVVPAEPSLHKFFGTVGYEPSFDTRMVEVAEALLPPAREDIAVQAIPPEEYGRLREDLLAGTFHICYDDSLLTYQAGLGRMSGGGLYQISADGWTGCAAVECLGAETVVFKELLLPETGEVLQAAAQIARRLPAKRYHIRTPACWPGVAGSYLQPFGMLKWFNREKEAAWIKEPIAYLGLGFD